MKLAFYLRLSLADGDLGKNNKDESNSIENQRLILQNFVESMDVILRFRHFQTCPHLLKCRRDISGC